METKQDKPLPQLPPNELWPLDHVSTRYDARIPQGVTLEDILKPAFWAHQASKLRPFDEIRARAEDGTWVAQLIVLDCSRTWARVAHLAVHHLTTADVAQTQASEQAVKAHMGEHKVTYRGQHKWSVVRNADGAVLVQGIEQKDEAQAWLEKHAREAIGAPAKQPEQAVAA